MDGRLDRLDDAWGVSSPHLSAHQNESSAKQCKLRSCPIKQFPKMFVVSDQRESVEQPQGVVRRGVRGVYHQDRHSVASKRHRLVESRCRGGSLGLSPKDDEEKPHPNFHAATLITPRMSQLTVLLAVFDGVDETWNPTTFVSSNRRKFWPSKGNFGFFIEVSWPQQITMIVQEVSYRNVTARCPMMVHFCAHYRHQGLLIRLLSHLPVLCDLGLHRPDSIRGQGTFADGPARVDRRPSEVR